MTLITSIIGRNISIAWRDGSDWLWYKLIDWDEVDGELWFLLEGRESPDGAKFSGSPFWIRLKDISDIELGDKCPLWEMPGRDDDSI